MNCASVHPRLACAALAGACASEPKVGSTATALDFCKTLGEIAAEKEGQCESMAPAFIDAEKARSDALSTVLAGLVVLQGLGDEIPATPRPQEMVGEAENLKTVAITDDPKIQLVPVPVVVVPFPIVVVPSPVVGTNLDEASQTGLLFDGPIDARRPAA